MTIYEESNLRVSLPDDSHFRFSSLEASRSVSGQSVKEMDFAWIHEGRLVLLEVKDLTDSTSILSPKEFIPGEASARAKRFEEIVDKVTDSLLMLLAAWGGTGWGRDLRAALPSGARRPLKLVLAVALELPQSLRVHLHAIRAALNHRLRGRLRLVDVESIAVLDYELLLKRKTFSPYVSRLAATAGTST